MEELRAAVEGCEVIVTFDSASDFDDDNMRYALAELADAMIEHRLATAEVSGYLLSIGGQGLGELKPILLQGQKTNTSSGQNCWGHDADTGHCTWNSSKGGPIFQPDSCTIHTVTK